MTRLKQIDFSFFAFLLFVPQLSFGFPENVRHGYANCTSCHVSPNGGGILTPYGRGLSREVLSTWGSEEEAQFLYGAFKLPDWLNLGGDVRAAQTYLNSPKVEQGKFIFMQADLEAAISYQKWQLVGAVGRQESTTFNLAGGTIFSRRHYLNYRPSDQISLRAGRFQTAFGINTADHIIVTKRGLRWDEGSETYNIEGAWLGDQFDACVTATFARPDAPQLNLDKGLALRSGVFLGERFKTGLSYFYGSNNLGSRHLIGPYGILGITPHFFVLAEIDFQNNRPNGAEPQWGAVNYLRVNYEFFRGVHAYVTQELSRLDFNNSKNTIEAYGVGLQFFPRPHLEIQAMYQKQRMLAVSSTFSDFAWLLLHFYP